MKIKIELCEANNTKGQLTLIINDYRVAGVESGFGYTILKSWDVDKEEVLEALK